MTRRYHLIRGGEIAPAPALGRHASGYRRASLVGVETGAVHMGLGLSTLAAGGNVDLHVHSYEESFFVLAGEPCLCLDGHVVQLRPGACGIVPVGMPHAWRHDTDDDARWIDMAAPRPRDDTQPPDTFYIAPTPATEATRLDVRDPRNRHLFALSDEDMDLDLLKQGAKVSAPTVSASMATAVLAYSGIAVKMLVDERLDAQLSTMFMVDYQPGAVAHPHDHPFEESYVMLDGVVDVVADDDRYTLEPGDVFWTGVGCIHAFYEPQGERVRWLETSAPQPPERHSYRFERDWQYLSEQLAHRDTS